MLMQERTCPGQLLNATIVVCGACYIMYLVCVLQHQPEQLEKHRAMPMQERTCLGRLLNATIVVCGACYILYVAVYLGLDLQNFIAKPSHDPVRLRLHLRSNPSDWVSSLPDNISSLQSQGAQHAGLHATSCM